MKLHELQPNEGKTKKRKRVGRGISAGQGKTAGRGTKGQGARAGGQGGNLPFFRRLPFKRGFTNINRVEYNEINIDQLVVFGADQDVTPGTLTAARLLRDEKKPVVILGRGDVNVALKVNVHRITKSARAKIEAAGGSVEIIEYGAK